MDSRKKRILYIYKDFSQFVRKDFESLSAAYRVRKIRSPFGKSTVSFVSAGIRQFLLLTWHIWRCDVIYCWFADYHSLLPALFSRIWGKRFYLVLGGYDVAYLEELNYGSYNKKFRGFCATYSMRAATLNLPVAEALGVEARARAGEIRVRALPTGYDPDLYLPSPVKEALILTVSLTSSWQRFMVKGLDRFMELARELPDMQFVIIGVDQEGAGLFREQPANLLVLPPTSHRDLLDWYGRARYYAQFSRSEGLPNAVCEAMLRNCIPLGIRTGGIPEAIGQAGFVLEHWDSGAMAQKVKECGDPDQLGRRAREHTIAHFHYRQRDKALRELIG